MQTKKISDYYLFIDMGKYKDEEYQAIFDAINVNKDAITKFDKDLFADNISKHLANSIVVKKNNKDGYFLYFLIMFALFSIIVTSYIVGANCALRDVKNEINKMHIETSQTSENEYEIKIK